MRVFEYRLLHVHSPINRTVQIRGHIGTAIQIGGNIALTYFF